MRWVLVHFLAFVVITQFLMGCTTPTKALNFLTPDRIGIGRTKGVMSMEGFSHGHYSGGYEDGWHHGEEWGETWSRSEFSGESEADMIWFEWDFPQWEEPNDYDLYLRERVRTLSLEKDLIIAERQLEKRDKAIDKTINRIDNILDCTPAEREAEGMWPKKLTE